MNDLSELTDCEVTSKKQVAVPRSKDKVARVPLTEEEEEDLSDALTLKKVIVADKGKSRVTTAGKVVPTVRKVQKVQKIKKVKKVEKIEKVKKVKKVDQKDKKITKNTKPEK